MPLPSIHATAIASDATWIGGTIATGSLSLLAFVGADDPETARTAAQGIWSTAIIAVCGLIAKLATLYFSERANRRANSRILREIRDELSREKTRSRKDRDINAAIQLRQRNKIDDLLAMQKAAKADQRATGLEVKKLGDELGVEVNPAIPPEGSGEHTVIL